MANGFKVPGQYTFDGFILCENFPPENILKVQSMELDTTDVVLASYPKCGTTLISEIVWLIRNDGNVELANETFNFLRVPFIEMKRVDGFDQFEKLPKPRHLKTHVPYRFLPKTVREGETKLVYIIRNPKDCLVSFYHFHRRCKDLGQFKGSWDNFFHYFKQNGYQFIFGNPLDHIRQFWEHKDDDNVFIIFFEDLLKDKRNEILKLAKFLGYNLSEESVNNIVDATSFKVMRENPKTNLETGFDNAEISRFMRKGEVGDWTNYFTNEQSEIVDEMVKDRLKGTGIVFTYE